MTVQIIPIGKPASEAERSALSYLQEKLSDDCTLLHNFEVQYGSDSFAVAIAVIRHDKICLLGARGTCGRTEAHETNWYPENYQPYTSPLLELRDHARELKTLPTDNRPPEDEFSAVAIEAVVFLTAPAAAFHDPSGQDSSQVITRESVASFFRNAGRDPGRQPTDTPHASSRKAHGRDAHREQAGCRKAGQAKRKRSGSTDCHKKLAGKLRVVSRPRSRLLRYGNWEESEGFRTPDFHARTRANDTRLPPGTHRTSKYVVEKGSGSLGLLGWYTKSLTCSEMRRAR